MPRPRAVLFDFDFTLVDGSEAIYECVRHACTCCGYTAPALETVKPMIGLPLPLVHAQLGGTEADQHRFIDAFHRRADDVMEPWTVLLPGAVEAVQALRHSGIRTGIVSTKLRRRLEDILTARSIRALFDVVLGLEDVPAAKPDPRGLLAALKAMEVPREFALYIGDHEVDAQAAQAAGVPFIGVLTGATTREQFQALGSPCAGALREIPGMLGIGE